MHETMPVLEPDLVRRAFDEAGGARWGVEGPAWTAALTRSVEGRFRQASPSPREVRDHVMSLHLADLALAAACIEGSGTAWDHFVLTFRPLLYRAADAVRGAGDAREVADALYAELYGLDSHEGERRSLLRYYHGRASLGTWLRSVLAQRIVDRVRGARRLVPFDESPGGGEDARDGPRAVGDAQVERSHLGRREDAGRGGGDPHRERYLVALHAALAAAIAALDAGLRLRLSLYYARGMKLSAIGRVVGESEATVSRRLDKARREIRVDVARRLREEHSLSEAQVALAFDYASGDETFDLRDVLPVPDS